MKRPLSLLLCLLLVAGSALAQVESGTGKNLSIDVKDADIRDVLKLIAEKADLNIIVEKSVRGNVTVRIKDEPVLRCLDLVTRINGFAFYKDGKSILVADERKLPFRTVTAVHTLKHLSAPEAAKIISMVIKKDIKVATEESGNGLVLAGDVEAMAQADLILRQLDRPRPAFRVGLRVKRGEKVINELQFPMALGEETNLSEGGQVFYAKGADQPPGKIDTGLKVSLSLDCIIPEKTVAGQISFELREVMGYQGNLPTLGRTAWKGGFQVPTGKWKRVVNLAGSNPLELEMHLEAEP